MSAVREKVLLSNPIKKSPLLGATIALEGIDSCLPLHHGPQGCTAFAKNFLTQHFREVIPMQNSALSDIATIMGDDTNLHSALKTVIQKHRPAMVAVVGTAVSETRGDDIPSGLFRFRQIAPECAETALVHLAVPDFTGDMELGYAQALTQIIEQVVEPHHGELNTDSVVVLPSVSLTPGDLRQIKRIIRAFGLRCQLFPDIAPAMGGSNSRYSTLPRGGITFDNIKTLGAHGTIIGIGQSTDNIGKALQQKTSAPFHLLPSLIGVRSTDALIDLCRTISGCDISVELLDERQLAIDAMLDSHFYWGEKQAALAGEPDLVCGLGQFLTSELGMALEAVVTTRATPQGQALGALVGDHDDLARLAAEADLLFGSTNSVPTAEKLGVPVIRVGYPVKDFLGQHQQCFVGYVGAMRLAYEIGNIFLEQHEHRAHKSTE